ncbi:protein kinase [candidate division KSB1 bacterium]|nr:protein kinase [candidate division KSB1 bacterium]
MIGHTISHYAIVEELGRGGMGLIYKAKDTKLKRFVALKFLPQDLTRDAQAVERFIQEAQAASALDHQNICTIYEFSETEEGQMFFVMAYYDGETLRQRINQSTINHDEAVDIVKQLCHGLSKAHARGIIHRDIKPANIILTRDGVLKILDFGLAKLARQIRITKQHSTLGTISYMSPEQLSGGKVDHRTDIWSIGVLFYEMLGGHLPFRGEIEQAVIYSILNEEPEPLSNDRNDVKSVERIILKSLEKAPEDRYASVDELFADIQTLASPPLAIRHKQKSIVVLPFENMSPDSNQDYISDGLTEEVITDLSQLSELRVISSSSAMAFKKAHKDIQKIRRQLDVQYMFEGSVRRAGDQLRIAAQLIDAKNDFSFFWMK